MKEVIESILTEEKNARERVEQARNEAKEIRLKAETEAEVIKKKAREDAEEAAKKVIADAEKAAMHDKEATLKNAESEGELLLQEKKEVLDQASERLFKMVVEG